MGELGHEDYVPNQDERLGGETPAFLLDVPVLNVDELDLEVNDLRAHISIRAELASFVKINVGVDLYLDKVKLDIKGLEAQALLKINLDKVLGTLDRALESININPQILNEVVQDVDSAAGGADEDTSQSTRESDGIEQAGGGARDQALGQGDRTEDRVVQGSGEVTEPAPNEPEETVDEEATSTLDGLQIEEEYVDERGRIVGRARDGSGNMVEGVLDDEGNVANPSVSEENGDRESEDDAGVDATDAARHKADKLGVTLSQVRGTGAGGRVLVKDVEEAAKQPAADSAQVLAPSVLLLASRSAGQRRRRVQHD
jgi:pyruvate/2-oxoglutarate dehydrogenase complex dihydrolipoamide acyltransferase (E2) component